MMLIILQNKLIYLPYLPPGARQETIEDYLPQLLGLDWTTTEVRDPRFREVTCMCCRDKVSGALRSATPLTPCRRPIRVSELVLVYFQGYEKNEMNSFIPYNGVL